MTFIMVLLIFWFIRAKMKSEDEDGSDGYFNDHLDF